MTIKLILTILTFLWSFSLFTTETGIYQVGNQLKSEKHSGLVLYHYKTDAIRSLLTTDFLLDESDFLLASVDVRNIYKVKKGDIIKLVKESKSGDVFKVQLLMKHPGRDYYFVESETLKHYKLIEPLSSSN